MTPLQKVAMGLVITIVDPRLHGYDGLPDVLGWVLVVLGLVQLRDRIPLPGLLPLALVSAIVSLGDFAPRLVQGLPESIGWALSLLQIAFSYVLCTEVAGLVQPPLARRFRGLRWAFVAVAAGPVLVYGGGLDVLLVPVAVLAVGTGVYLVYLLFRASTEVHGPQVRIRPQPPETEPGTEQ